MNYANTSPTKTRLAITEVTELQKDSRVCEIRIHVANKCVDCTKDSAFFAQEVPLGITIGFIGESLL